MKVSLVVVKGKPEGMEIPLKAARFVIGREPGCQLRPGSDLVSKQHCVFTIDGESLTIEDLGSTNGTFLNGTRLSKVETVRDCDLVKVGPLTFAVKIASAKPASAPSLKAESDESGDLFDDWLHDPTAGQPDPQANSTIMEMRALSVEDTIAETSLHPIQSPTDKSSKQPSSTSPPKGSAPPVDAKKGSSEAASDMLNKLMIRRRGLS